MEPNDSDNGEFFIDREHCGIMEEAVLDGTATETEGKSSEWARKLRKRLWNDEPTTPTEGNSAKKPRRRNCFNCLGDHNISECKEPKNFAAIRKNKAEFMNSFTASPSARISSTPQATSPNQRKPGKISDRLRNALDLGKDDIPEYIYRMRRMGFKNGYPPGYLRKALSQNFAGDTLKFITESTPQNDADEDKPRPPPTVDHKKIHFFMGFNKTYNGLRDRERGDFSIPPFDTFCEMLQTHVEEQHDDNEKARVIENRERRNQMKKSEEKRKAESDTIGSEEEKEAESKNSQEGTELKGVAEKTILVPMGESISVLVGTPVFDRQGKIPGLEAFAEGIIPFEAKEEDIGGRGTFKKIMDMLKEQKK